tara:strand:- start:472 stop:753 length:282 start_codon:yes stop_codon:yes gene_type:complete
LNNQYYCKIVLTNKNKKADIDSEKLYFYANTAPSKEYTRENNLSGIKCTTKESLSPKKAENNKKNNNNNTENFCLLHNLQHHLSSKSRKLLCP